MVWTLFCSQSDVPRQDPEMVATPEWQAIVKERGWVDLHLPAAEFGPFLAAEQSRIAGILKDTGLIQ